MEAHNTSDDSTETQTIEIRFTLGHSRDDDVDTESRAFGIARDLRGFGTDAFVEFERDAQEAFDTALDTLATFETEVGDVGDFLEQIFTRAQGGVVDEQLGYDGSETRSMGVGDVVVIDGTAYMAERFGFSELDVDTGSDDEDDDEPRRAADRFPCDGVEIEAGDFVWIDGGVVDSYAEPGEGASQGCDVVDVDGDELTVEYPRHAETETATVSREHVRETDLEKWDRVELSYDSRYTADDAPRTMKTATVLHVHRGRGFEGIVVETDDGSELRIQSTGGVKTRGDTARRIARDATVDAVISRESDDTTVGCLGCGFGYDGDEYDTCPVCADEDDDDGDDGADDADADDEQSTDDTDEWSPETAELRDGEEGDVSGHAARNAAQLAMYEADDGQATDADVREAVEQLEREEEDELVADGGVDRGDGDRDTFELLEGAYAGDTVVVEQPTGDVRLDVHTVDEWDPGRTLHASTSSGVCVDVCVDERTQSYTLEIASWGLGVEDGGGAAERDDRHDVATDGGFPVDDERAEWCPDCQRHRVGCVHDDEPVTDGGRREFTEWRDFVNAAREGDALTEGDEVCVEYDSAYSDDPQQVRGRVTHSAVGESASHPFKVETQTDGVVRWVRGWHVVSGSMGGPKIGRVRRIVVGDPEADLRADGGDEWSVPGSEGDSDDGRETVELAGDRVLIEQRGAGGSKRTGRVKEIQLPETADGHATYVVDLDGAGVAHVTRDVLIPTDEIPFSGVLMNISDACVAFDCIQVVLDLLRSDVLDVGDFEHDFDTVGETSGTLGTQLILASDD